MYHKHITHKVFLAYTIIGSTLSILGRLLCLSQQYQFNQGKGNDKVLDMQFNDVPVER